jgi:hypothetical protein
VPVHAFDERFSPVLRSWKVLVDGILDVVGTHGNPLFWRLLNWF